MLWFNYKIIKKIDLEKGLYNISIIPACFMTENTMNTNIWNPTNFKYMSMNKSDRGIKSIQLQNSDTKRAIKLRTTLMMTWGIQDYFDKNTGVSDGKFNIVLNFPRDEDDHKNEESDMFLQKLKDFENQIIDDAVKNSSEWFDESLPKEVIKHNYFSFIKYPKNKDTNKFDYTRPPSIKVKVPCYDNKNDGTKDWKVELYSSVDDSCLFPDTANPNLVPQDFVPKLSTIYSYIQCNGLWFGGKGWGVTWKLTAAIVNPLKIQGYETVKPSLGLTQKEKEMIGMTSSSSTDDTVFKTPEPVPIDTQVVDSDDEEESASVHEPVPEEIKEIPEEIKEVPEEIKEVPEEIKEVPKKKKVIKKAVKP